MESQPMKAAIEAILFAAGYPVRYAAMAEALSLSEEEVRRLAEELSADKAEVASGIQLVLFGDTCQLCTKEVWIEPIRAVLGVKRGGNLSRSSLETLAIVAYHQPVTKSYIEQLRSIDSAYAVNNLVEKKLIEVCGRLDAPGRPALYRTTEDFLRVFGLSSLTELPPAELFGEVVPAQELPEAADGEQTGG